MACIKDTSSTGETVMLKQKVMNASDVRSSTEVIMDKIRKRPEYLNDKGRWTWTIYSIIL